MSSSGRGGPIERPPTSDCSTLRDKTPLNSVDSDVLRGVNIGDILPVTAQGDRGPLVVTNKNGEVLGSITSMKLAALLRCINDGFEFVAEVESISGGQVVVLIRAK